MIASLRIFFVKLINSSHSLFLLIALPAVILFLVVLPPAWGLDEQVHIARSYQVSQGNWYPDKLAGKGHFGGAIPQSLEVALSHGHAVSNSVNREASFLDRKDDPNPSLTNKIDSESIKSSLVIYDFGPTGPYAPVPYIPSAVGMGVGRMFDLSVGSTVLLARLFQAVFFLTVVAFALWLLRGTRARWVLFTVALLPSVMYQAITVNADAYTIAVSLLFSAVIYRLLTANERVDRRWVALLALSSVALVFTKPSYALLLGLIPFIPKNIFGSRKRSLIIKASVLFGGFIILGAVSYKGLAYGDSILLYRDPTIAASINLTDQIIYILSHPIHFFQVMIESIVRYGGNWGTSVVGLLGYNTISTPYPFMILAYISLFVTSLYSKDITRKQAWWMLAVSIVSAVSVIVLLYGTFNGVGAGSVEGVQGRYFIPCAPLFLVAMGRLLPMRISASDKSIGLIHVIVSILVLYVTTIAYVIAVT